MGFAGRTDDGDHDERQRLCNGRVHGGGPVRADGDDNDHDGLLRYRFVRTAESLAQARPCAPALQLPVIAAARP
jgi:hypothetical protein